MRIRDWDRNLKVRLFGEAAINITFWMFFPFLTIYFTEAFGKQTAGLLLVLSQVFAVAANLMGGYCADRFGRKTMMVISAFGQGFAFLIFGLASSPWLDSAMIGFICFSLVGVFGSFYWPASQAMVADVVDEKDRSHVFAVFYTSINIAVVVGPILGGIFYVHYRFELLVAAAIICMGLSFLLYKMTRETAPGDRSKLLVTEGKKKAWYSVMTDQFRDYGVIFKDKTFLLFILAGILVGQTFMQLDLLIPVYIKDVMDKAVLFSIGDWSLTLVSEQIFGLILSENGFFVALLTVVITRWITKFRERNVFILSSVIYAGSILMFGLSSSVWFFIAAMAVFTFAELMTAGIQQSFVSKLAPDHMRGQYFAAASLRFTIARTIAPLSITLSLYAGYNWTFIILSLLALISAGLFYIMFERFEKEEIQLKKAVQ
ncbi:MFS transporter [[Bacillus] enclensis]|uniref:Dipeptide/tripeptide permease n=2 Tax=Rossellomorea TaxID=2837508 RepID=A0A0V8HHH9_9BACI|nr:MFS transporter [[Bacillus] enclensis]KSU61940.1 MFS transporter [[Bacillus] enclensis]OAT80162.1 MFS transporter [Bacillus sp. MKU004]SCC17502.1 Dipeptide/tripeptide permease [[Bacillus] enclensis]